MDPRFNQDFTHPFHVNKTTNYIPCKARKESEAKHMSIQ